MELKEVNEEKRRSEREVKYFGLLDRSSDRRTSISIGMTHVLLVVLRSPPSLSSPLEISVCNTVGEKNKNKNK